MHTVSDALTFISAADRGVLENLEEAIRQRKATISQIEVAALTEGALVVIHGIRPAYYNDMKGHIIEIQMNRRKRCARIALSDASDRRLVRHKTGEVPSDEPLTLDGVPLVCLRKIES